METEKGEAPPAIGEGAWTKWQVLTNHSLVYERGGTLLPGELPARRASWL
jgi:hypothetical protein